MAVEKGAGLSAGFEDADYEQAGATLQCNVSEMFRAADMVLCIAPPEAAGIDHMTEGTLIAGMLNPYDNRGLLQILAERRMTALALELVPRITRAQSMDALSSQSSLAGYRAVIIGAEALGSIFPLMMTAAGTLFPARVLVLGAGVAGLQAIATAKRLGAETWGYDIRTAAAEQVESLGARFVDLNEDAPEGAADTETEGGYARELDEAEAGRRRHLLAEHIARADVVITTALVPGRPAPRLIDAETARGMKRGSVIVDLAGPAGGNCELTRPGETFREGGLTILAPLNLPADVPTHASQLLARNLSALVAEVISDNGLAVDLENDVIGPCCVTHAGEIRFGG